MIDNTKNQAQLDAIHAAELPYRVGAPEESMYTQVAVIDARGHTVLWSEEIDGDPIETADDRARRVVQALNGFPGVAAALRTLVRADSVNYARDTMRYERLFDAGRQALRDAGECVQPHPYDSPIWTPAESAPALRDMLRELVRASKGVLRQGMTVEHGGLLAAVAERAELLLEQTPSNE